MLMIFIEKKRVTQGPSDGHDLIERYEDASKNHRGSPSLTLLNVLGVLGVLTVPNMPMDALLACWALFLSF